MFRRKNSGDIQSDVQPDSTGSDSYGEKIMQKLQEIMQSTEDIAQSSYSDLSALSAVTALMPSVTTTDKYLTSAHAFGQEMNNLTAMQLRTNMLALKATSGCVSQLLNLNPYNHSDVMNSGKETDFGDEETEF